MIGEGKQEVGAKNQIVLRRGRKLTRSQRRAVILDLQQVEAQLKIAATAKTDATTDEILVPRPGRTDSRGVVSRNILER